MEKKKKHNCCQCYANQPLFENSFLAITVMLFFFFLSKEKKKSFHWDNPGSGNYSLPSLPLRPFLPAVFPGPVLGQAAGANVGVMATGQQIISNWQAYKKCQADWASAGFPYKAAHKLCGSSEA